MKSALLAGILLLTTAAAQSIQYERPVQTAPQENTIGGGYKTPGVQKPLPRDYRLQVLDVVLLAPLWVQVAHLLGADTLWAALVVLTARVTLQPKEAA